MKHGPDGKLEHVSLWDGPWEGQQVPHPPFPDRQHCIAMPAPPESQSLCGGDGKVYCFYLWMVHSQRYRFVAEDHCSGNQEAEAKSIIIADTKVGRKG